MFAIHPEYDIKNIAPEPDFFIVGLLLKFLSMVKVLLINGHQLLELKKLFFYVILL